MDDVTKVRSEFNQRFDQFESRIAPLFERIAIALERLAAHEKDMDGLRDGILRLHDRIDDHCADDVQAHTSIRAEIGNVRTELAADRPQNSRIREWVDRLSFAAVLLVCYLIGKTLGWVS